MKTLLSLFDYSGAWSSPFEDSGKWNVIHVDIKNGFDIMSIDSAEKALSEWGDVDGIISAPPCTDFAVSGSQYWRIKDSDGRTGKSLSLLAQTFRIVDLYRPTDPDYYTEGGSFFWAVENPVGRLPELIKAWPCVDIEDEGGWTDRPFKPRYFQPHDYAGWLISEDQNPTLIRRTLDGIREKCGIGLKPHEVDFVVRWNAYTKKTGLWGDFVFPDADPVTPVRCCRQGSPVQCEGGSSVKTKEIRSNTPMGFAKAFFAANN